MRREGVLEAWGGLGPPGEFPELEIMVVKIGTTGLRYWRNLQASV